MCLFVSFRLSPVAGKASGVPVAFVEAGTVSPKIAIISISGKKSPDLPGGSYGFCGADMADDDKKTLRLA